MTFLTAIHTPETGAERLKLVAVQVSDSQSLRQPQTAMTKDYHQLFKLVLIGDTGVGKSCLLLRADTASSVRARG